MDERDTIPIPQPPGYPIIGNVSDIDPEVPIQSLGHLARQYGEIFSLTIFGKKRIFISTQALLNELCDEKRFDKNVGGPLEQLRHGVNSGLFTGHTDEEDWGVAHRTLVPAFGPLNITAMFDDMKDIASQLVLKWARYGSSYKIPPTDDFTRLTLDTLALCAMDYRFNSFYSEEMHPFISAMVGFLSTGGNRARRPGYLAPFFRADDQQFFKDIEYMRNLSNDLVNERKEHPTESKDLLNAMVKGKDPKTGKNLSHDSIIDNMITFLIAGHETTSGLLSFQFYFLLKNPEAYRKAQEEVDTVLGRDSIQPEHINKLHYVQAVLRETLRLQPTAPAFSVSPKAAEGEILGGKYHVKKGENVASLLSQVHRDPAIYGEDAEEWKPERMLDEYGTSLVLLSERGLACPRMVLTACSNFNKLPPNSWKPFGNGARGCIGRPFAWQEAVLVTAMLLQYFNFALEDPQYNLKIKTTLTIKPKDFFMKATLREGWTATKIEQSLSGSMHGPGPQKKGQFTPAKPSTPGKPLTILYGSNSGTCESFAQTLAADAAAHGFTATKVDTLDSAKQGLPIKEPIVIVTASYEGAPCDNAAHFFDWLQNLKEEERVAANFAVFGCGHSDWKQTFNRIPNTIDALLEQHGGKRICQRASANAAKGDMMSDFQDWEDSVFWPAMQKQFGGEDSESESAALGQGLSIEVFSRRASQLRADVHEAKILATRTLTAPGVPAKRHIELQLPSEMTYKAGDYLAILPMNPRETVHRVMIRFGLPWDAMLSITSKTGSSLPTDTPISATSLFYAYVELSQPATKRNVAMLIEAAKDEKTKTELSSILEDDFAANVLEKRVSLLDLLERFPRIELPLSAFVASLISMRVRQYSISYSPLADPNKATLTYAVLDAPSMAGQGRYVGVASNYLSSLKPGDITHVAVKPSHQAFHLPTDTETPVIMICAGTGLAPFRGFVQERAAKIGAGRKLAPAHLYMGCRHPDKDELYREDFALWETMKAVTIHRAFSQATEMSEGHKHVDDAMRADTDLLLELWEQGARVYVCGSRELGESVKKACLDIAHESARRLGKEKDEEKAQKWFDSIRNDRYSTDVFA